MSCFFYTINLSAMKNIFLVISLVCLPFLASAQLGIKAGANLGVAQVEDRDVDWDNDGVTVGMHAGTFVRMNLGRIYLQPEAYYTFAQAQLRNHDIDANKLSVDFHRLDVPVLLGYRITDHFRINAGPFASVNIRANASGAERDWNSEVDDYYNRTQFGWQAGIGFDIWRFTLDTRYETTVGNLRDFDFSNSTWDTYLPDEQKQRQIVVSLGYRFGKAR
ncbi:hypothetical protein D770_06625 [Flammeovirgaceae bacterium 311]|nr:hypothetical protein D770_06625 [Flammeovirgaceae bacterium 311]